MTTTNFTTSLGLALPTTGDLSGTWGDTVNDYISKYLDTAVAGALTVSTDVTLTKTTNSVLGATSSQYAILIASGHAANITVTAPAISKVYLVINKSGSYTVKIRGTGPTTGITVPVSSAALVAWDGSDFALVSTTDINNLSGVLTAVKGGTGQSSYTVGDLLYASTTTALSKLADVATGNALISGGVGVAPSYGKIGLTTHVDGTLPVANGGTGAASLTANNVILGNGTSAVQFVAPGTSGNVLTSNGTTWTSAAVAASLSGVTQSATPFETALGHQAGNVSTGIDNTFVGYQSGLVVSTGNNNTAVGHSTLTACTTGFYNTAVGASALELGAAGINSCTAIGFNALASVSGNNNTAVGSQAGSSIGTGTNNTYVGSLASASSSSVDREIVIGYNLTGKGTQTAFIGGTSGAYNAKNVSTWETTSDERIKRNIVDSPKGLAEVNQLRVRNFNYKTVDQMPLDANGNPIIDNLDPDRLITGFIAQELQQVMPECVHMTASGLLAVSSDPIIYALVKAVQQLSAEVEQLKQR